MFRLITLTSSLSSLLPLLTSPITITILAVLATLTMLSLFGPKTNHFPVAGRTVLLTGASEGMGLSAAIQLAQKGASLILVSRNVGRLEEALAAVRAAAVSPAQRFTYISADVALPDYASSVIAEAIAWNNGRAPDIVWCVAGLSTPMLWTATGSLDAARRNMDVNYFGAAEMSRAILREWLDPKGETFAEQPRHIVFTASVLALFAIVGYAPYTPSKWALRALADTLAMELLLYEAERPVRVHVVFPATITSPGLARENQTKPAITLELEKEEPPETPDTVARRALEGLERGEYFVTVSFLGRLMRCGIMGGSGRNSWVVDTVWGWFVPIVYFFVLLDLNGKVRRWGKRGHPGLEGTNA